MEKQQNVIIPAMMIPSWNISQAFERGNQSKFLLTTWGGLGDQVCAEPTLRHALKAFDKCQISLATETPDLFTHLKFHEVMPFKKVQMDLELQKQYMIFNTIVPPDHLTWEFFSHCLTNAVDFASLCAFRLQLPIAEKHIVLEHGLTTLADHLREFDRNNMVVVHAGRHWPSKTFPKPWWDRVLASLRARGLTPVLIGKNNITETSGNTGTVDVNTDGCIDLRNKTSIKELIWLLQNARVLLTNDSSPLHIAASGKAWIGFVASCKHPDYIMHVRNGQFGWRQQNLGLDGIWNYLDHNPAQECEVKVDELPEGVMEKLLPAPDVLASWAEHKIKLVAE